MTPLQQNAQNHYQAQQILNASKEQLLIMLFDGAIRFLKVAKKALLEKDIATCHTHLLKSQKIMTELMTSLNFDVGGDVARNLYNLYEYYYYRLVQANLKKDPAMIDEVLDHLVALRGTWADAIKQAAHEGKAKSSPSSVQPL
jgi:flagellar secretion chaperone FliS